MLIFTEEIEIERGVTYKHSFYIMDNEGAVINTDAYTPTLTLKNTVGRYANKVDLTKYLDKETLKAHGLILLDIPYAETHELPIGKGEFELIVDNEGAKEIYKIAEGTYSIKGRF